MRTSIVGVALDAVEHFEAAPAARAFDGIGGIGNLLEFLEHKTRHDDESLDEFALRSNRRCARQ